MAEIEHSPTDPQRQGPGRKPHLTFVWHCSCSVHILYPLVIHWRGCVIKIFLRNRWTLIYDERISQGLTFAWHWSSRVHILYPLVIHWRGCVIKIFSWNRWTLNYFQIDILSNLTPWKHPSDWIVIWNWCCEGAYQYFQYFQVV